MSERIETSFGRVVRVAGPVVEAEGLENARLYDVVHVGNLRLIGEVIRLSGTRATIQVYEETFGVRVGEPVENTRAPLTVLLGPGLLGQIYDGLQRPLKLIAAERGNFIGRGISVPALPADRAWRFIPWAAIGDHVEQGDVLGVVHETEVIEHRVMVPPGVHGRLQAIEEGDYTVEDVIAVIELEGNNSTGLREVRLAQRWPVRKPRPCQAKLEPREPLITGTRIIDGLYPVAKGGTAIVPGGFGTGKTVLEQSLARWADADIVVYVGCGERGNEMAEVLEEFPTLTDFYTGLPLMNRTVLIANTSNMPVAAREASIYTGITLGEYYRDMGYDVLLLADSTSRWGEALREISGRLEEIPGEEGYPAYLAARLSEFYERSGNVIGLGRGIGDGGKSDSSPRTGSLTIIGAVSPPGGDFSEPISQSSMRVAGTFWALDYALSRARHFPAISWSKSYTLYDFSHWYTDRVSREWNELVHEANVLLEHADELEEIVQLVGPEALSDPDKLSLAAARMMREDFLQQSSLDPVDRFCAMDKTLWMLKAILEFYRQGQLALEAGIELADWMALPEVAHIARMKELPPEQAAAQIQSLVDHIQKAVATTGASRDAKTHPLPSTRH